MLRWEEAEEVIDFAHHVSEDDIDLLQQNGLLNFLKKLSFRELQHLRRLTQTMDALDLEYLYLTACTGCPVECGPVDPGCDGTTVTGGETGAGVPVPTDREKCRAELRRKICADDFQSYVSLARAALKDALAGGTSADLQDLRVAFDAFLAALQFVCKDPANLELSMHGFCAVWKVYKNGLPAPLRALVNFNLGPLWWIFSNQIGPVLDACCAYQPAGSLPSWAQVLTAGSQRNGGYNV